ncbi:hypothetical protein FACS189411_01260 [Bacteroidia bacterium]|nr:hypothetical protein FACS189411_01260 [Bacteroidia bacterium]
MFIYSFDYDENIYIADINHTTLRNIKAKSRYIDHVENPDDLYLTIEQSCMNPHYDNLVYDPYRQVYYRIAQPKIKWDKGTNVQEFIDYGGKNFSIIILDNNFNVVGETMFPDNTYNPRALFIREDGLYISSSHFKNPDYSDDWFVFQRFDLVKQQL